MLQREVVISLTSFVTELALAWQKLSMYQPGHPERDSALDRAHAVIVGLVAPTGSLTLGVGQGALIGPEEKLASPPAARLAAALYLLGVAFLRIDEGVEKGELEHLLDVLPRTGDLPEGRDIGAELQQRAVQHIRVEAVDFKGLVATDNLEDSVNEKKSGSLWDRLLQRILNDERFGLDPLLVVEPGGSQLHQIEVAVGEVLDRYGIGESEIIAPGDNTPAEEVVDVLSDLVGEAAAETMLEAGDEGGRRSSARHVKELLSAMPEGLRQGMLDAAVRELVTRDEAAPGLHSLASAVSAAQMVGSLRRLRADKVGFAPRAVSAVESLVVDGSQDIARPGKHMDPDELAQELRSIFGNEDVDRTPLSSALDDRIFLELRRHVPVHAMFADLSPYLETITDEKLQADLSITLVDLLRRPFLDDAQVEWVIDRQRETFRDMLAASRFGCTTRIVESLRDLATSERQIEAVRLSADRCLQQLGDPETLSAIVENLGAANGDDLAQLHQLIEVLGPETIRQLLVVLGEETELSRRRHIFDLLTSLGPRVVPAAISLLGDQRWYMVRNILSLLRRVGHGLSLEIVENALANDDARVRLEAVKCLSGLGVDVTPSLVEKVLNDPDPRVAEMAIGVCGSAKIGAAAKPLVELLNRPDRLGRQRRLRLRALQALGELGDATVLPQIAPLFRSWFAPVAAEEQHAAFRSLELYPERDRRPWLKKGRRSLDPVIRKICQSLEHGGRG